MADSKMKLGAPVAHVAVAVLRRKEPAAVATGLELRCSVPHAGFDERSERFIVEIGSHSSAMAFHRSCRYVRMQPRDRRQQGVNLVSCKADDDATVAPDRERRTRVHLIGNELRDVVVVLHGLLEPQVKLLVGWPEYRIWVHRLHTLHVSLGELGLVHPRPCCEDRLEARHDTSSTQRQAASTGAAADRQGTCA